MAKCVDLGKNEELDPFYINYTITIAMKCYIFSILFKGDLLLKNKDGKLLI